MSFGAETVKAKLISGLGLLLFVAAAAMVVVLKDAGVPAGIASHTGTTGASSESDRTPGTYAVTSPDEGRKVVAYYFHTRVRCVSCLKIEALSRKAVADGFRKELKEGRLEFRDVDVGDPRNRHFIEDFRLVSQSLVLVEIRNGQLMRWRNLDKVWTLLGSERDFIPYVKEGVRRFLGNP
jgi:hypothetical protein